MRIQRTMPRFTLPSQSAAIRSSIPAADGFDTARRPSIPTHMAAPARGGAEILDAVTFNDAPWVLDRAISGGVWIHSGRNVGAGLVSLVLAAPHIPLAALRAGLSAVCVALRELAANAKNPAAEFFAWLALAIVFLLLAPLRLAVLVADAIPSALADLGHWVAGKMDPHRNEMEVESAWNMPRWMPFPATPEQLTDINTWVEKRDRFIAAHGQPRPLENQPDIVAELSALRTSDPARFARVREIVRSTRTTWLARFPSVALLERMLSPPNPNSRRPLAVMIMTRSDWNFATRKFMWEGGLQRMIDAGYDVVYREASSDREAIAQARTISASGRRSAFTSMWVHGRTGGMSFGSYDGEDEDVLDVDEGPMMAELADTMTTDATMLLMSCSTGHGGALQQNVANTMAQALPGRTVIAPTEDTNIDSIEYGPNGRVENVIFRDCQTYRVREP